MIITNHDPAQPQLAACAPATGPSRRGAIVGAALPVLLGILMVQLQMRFSAGGLALDLERAAAWGLSPSSLQTDWWPLVAYPFLHGTASQLAVSLAVLLLFGVPLGWTFGAWMVAVPFLMGALIGGLAALADAVTHGTGAVFGASGAVAAVMAAAMFLRPRGGDEGGWGAWTLYGGYLAFALLGSPVAEMAGLGRAPCLPILAAVWAGVQSGLFVSAGRDADCRRVGAGALAVAAIVVCRFWSHAGALARAALSGADIAPWNSTWGPWIGILIDLLILAIATIYVLSQAGIVADRRRWSR